MIYIAYFTFGFAVVQLLVAFVNLIFSQKFPITKTVFNGLVSILIPTRNEEKNIGNLLTDIQNQDYQNIEILVFNDLSTDRTAEIVSEYSKLDNRIKLIHSSGLPDGWLGKNYACHNLSHHANGAYFLFLDADVQISNDIIINSIGLSKRHNLGLLSIFPKQMMITKGEQISVPVMNYILLSLLPLILVRKLNFPSLAAANGQFMLFDSVKYLEYLPHEKMKANKVEDIEIARFYKQNKIKIAVLTGNDTITCRMYNSFSDAANGFSKNVVNFFGNSFALATIFWLITTFGFLVVLFNLSTNTFLFYILILLITRILISVSSQQNILQNIIFLIPQQFALGLFIYKAIINKLKNQHQWKGRNIS